MLRNGRVWRRDRYLRSLVRFSYMQVPLGSSKPVTHSNICFHVPSDRSSWHSFSSAMNQSSMSPRRAISDSVSSGLNNPMKTSDFLVSFLPRGIRPAIRTYSKLDRDCGQQPGYVGVLDQQLLFLLHTMEAMTSTWHFAYSKHIGSHSTELLSLPNH